MSDQVIQKSNPKGGDVYVGTQVKWLHEYVLGGQNKERVTYNQLPPIQWMAGFVGA